MLVERSDTPKPTRRELRKFAREIEDGLIYSRKKGEINLVWIPLGGRIQLIKDAHGHLVHVTEVVPLYTYNVKAARKLTPDIEGILPPELALFSKVVTLDEVLSELPSFLRNNFPQVEGLPINIFESRRAFQKKSVLASIRIGKLVERTA